MHNIHHQLSLMQAARSAILDNHFPEFVVDFFDRYYHNKAVPAWAAEALRDVGIEVRMESAG